VTISGLVDSSTLPMTIKPMLAHLTREPFDSPDHIFELKWDGIRTLAFIEDGKLRLQTRTLRDVTSQFPELHELPRSVKADQAVLDGELVCFDKEGHPSFQLMSRRLHRQEAGQTVHRPRAHYVAFDILYADGRSVMDEPLMLRKQLLQYVLDSSDVAQPSEFIENDGKAFFKATCDHSLEGIMAKEKSSAYYPGKRSPSWHKVKRVRECEFVVGGYAFGGRRKEMFGSLLLGLYDRNQRLVFVGQVNNGFTAAEAKRIHSVLQSLHTDASPFESEPQLQKFVFWCRPEIVCRVEYGEFTMDGKLRYPVYVTQREDKSPSECKIDHSPGWPSALPVG